MVAPEFAHVLRKDRWNIDSVDVSVIARRSVVPLAGGGFGVLQTHPAKAVSMGHPALEHEHQDSPIRDMDS